MKFFVLSAIQFYKKRISPYKGFSCAYRVHTGRASCSTLGYRAISRYGVWRGLKVLRQRLIKCGVAHRRYSDFSMKFHKQAGYCDLPCDIPCDLHFHDFSCVGDLLSGCTPCDCGNLLTSKRSRDDEKEMHIPQILNSGYDWLLS